MTDSARQVLFAFDAGDSEDLVVACNNLRQIIPSISRLAKAAKLSSTTQSVAKPSVLVAAVAMLISLAGSGVDQQSLASPALAALSSLVQSVYEVPPQSPDGAMDESRVQAGRSLAVLLDQLAKLPNATGKSSLLLVSERNSSSRTAAATTPNQACAPYSCSAIDRHVGGMDWFESPTPNLNGQNGSFLT